ncbi:MAG: presqualene diphosphate synthase HpnD [Alphaproteobacteria bacterium]|nr:presqualene diphosphate synthase HpnD [Alphaproteobacteria bacterium]
MGRIGVTAATTTDKRDLDAHIEDLVRRSGTSFFWGMRVLPPERRRAMYAVYAFCREVDDIADGDLTTAAKIARLDAWGEEIARLYAGGATEPIARALAPAVASFGLAKDDFLAVIEGMRIDAAARLRVADMAALLHYCDCVACAVGRLSNPVFGIGHDPGDRLAKTLGEALQLTNILRDLDEDAARDRLYLPADLLARHGIQGGDLAAVLSHPKLPDACAEIAAIAGERFAAARAILAQIGARERRPAVLMMQPYWRTYRRLLGRGFAPPRARVRLPGWEKLWVAFRYGVL